MVSSSGLQEAKSVRQPHISICVCTYKRPAYLLEMLGKLLEQRTEDRFSFSIVVVDNDIEQSAHKATKKIATLSPRKIDYSLQPKQNIALARNQAVARAQGEFIAFIDDDELPESDWLLRMYSELRKRGVDGVLGPVQPQFEVPPPDWILRGRLFERPVYPTGYILDWRQTRTGNALLRRSALDSVDGPFRHELGSGGEDRDFFRRAIGAGKIFVWCNDAPVLERVPQARTRLSFQLKRALLRGRMSVLQPSFSVLEFLKSTVACAAYTILLPALFLWGRHMPAKFLIKYADHLGKILAACHIYPIKDKYVLD
jgi:succinoglycan biosynthesis protein ExoM